MKTSLETRDADGTTTCVVVPVPDHAVPAAWTSLRSGRSYRRTTKPGSEPWHSGLLDELEASGTLVTQGPVPDVAAPDVEIAAQLLAGFDREAAGVVSAPGPFRGHVKDPRKPEARAVVDLTRKWLCGIPRDERFAALRRHVPADVYDDNELRALVVTSEAKGYEFANVERERAEAARAKLKATRQKDRERSAIAALDAQEEREFTPDSLGQVCVHVAANVFTGVHPSHPMRDILLNARRLDLPDGGRIVFFNHRSFRHGEVEVDRGIRILASDAPIQMTSAEWAQISRVINSSWPPHVASLIANDRKHDARLFFGPVAERAPATPEEAAFRLAAATSYARDRIEQLERPQNWQREDPAAREPARFFAHEVTTGFALDPLDSAELLIRLARPWLAKLPNRAEAERGIAADCMASAMGEIQPVSLAVGELLPKIAWTEADGTDLVLACLRAAVAGRDSVSFSEAKQAVIASGLIEATSWSNIASRTITEKLRELGLERAVVEDETGQRRRAYVRGAERSDDLDDAPAIPEAPPPVAAPTAPNAQISTWRLRMSGSNKPSRPSMPEGVVIDRLDD